MADGNTANTDGANSQAGANAGDAQSRLVANERARQALNGEAGGMTGASMANATLNRLAENSRVRNQLRGKIDAIVDKQDVVLPDKKKKNRKRMWIIIGVVLAILAIGGGVTAAILINNANQEGGVADGDVSESCGTDDGADDGNFSSEEKEAILLEIVLMKNEMKYPDSVEYLTTELEAYQDTNVGFDITMLIAHELLNNGDEEGAFKLVDAINLAFLEDRQYIDYYWTMSEIQFALGYEELGQYYQDQYVAVYNDIYNEDDEQLAQGDENDDSGESIENLGEDGGWDDYEE